MRVSKRLVILFILLITLLGLLLWQNSPALILQEYGAFVLLGLAGAIFANSTGAGGNLFPASTTIFADKQIRGKITVLMVIQRNIHGIRIMKIGSDVVDKRSIGDTR